MLSYSSLAKWNQFLKCRKCQRMQIWGGVGNHRVAEGKKGDETLQLDFPSMNTKSKIHIKRLVVIPQ